MNNTHTLQDLLKNTVRRAWEHRHAYRLKPRPTSVAYNELHPPPDESSRIETIQTAYSAATMRVVATEDALRSMATSLEDQPFAIASLARSSLEWCALARWLFDHKLGTKARLGRGMTDYMYSLWQVSRVVEKPTERTRLLKRIEEEKQEAIDFGLRVEAAGGWQKGLYFAEERRPTTTFLIDELLKPVAPGLGAFLWQLLSGITHGTTGFMMEMFKEERPPDLIHADDQPFAKKSATRRTLMMASASLLGYLEAFGEMVRLYGWDEPAWKEWTERHTPILIRLLLNDEDGPSPEVPN